MPTLRHAACLLVAAASIALAAWQPVITADDVNPAAGVPAGDTQPADVRIPATVDRAVLLAPLLKA